MNDQDSELFSVDYWKTLNPVQVNKKKVDGLIPDLWNALFGSVETMNFRDRLMGPGEKPEITAPTDDPYRRSYEEIISIQQKGSRGFRTFDINPFTVTQDDYPCHFSSGVLGNLFGFEDGAVCFGYGSDSNINPFWRTISIDANATWIKIEYLPSRVNDVIRGASVGLEPYNLGPVIDPQAGGPTFPDNGTGWTGVAVGWPGKPSATSQVVLQFDDPNGSPILAKHGDGFKIPFNTVFITFKMWSPRIRITCGYDTEINGVDDRMLMTRPAFAGGNGLLQNANMHYVPFCITAGDVIGVDGESLSLPMINVRTDTLITNYGAEIVSKTPPYPLIGYRPLGQGLLWITGFSASVLPPNNSDVPPGFYRSWLSVVTQTGSIKLRRICHIDIPLSGGIGQG